MFQNKRGRIIVKISYDEMTNLDLNSDCDLSHQNVSYRKKTTREIQRNHQRAQNFRENIQPSKRPRHNSTEIPRQNLNNSSPIPNIDISLCEKEESRSESPTHDLSTSSPYFEPESIKPKEHKSPSVTPVIVLSEKPTHLKQSPKRLDQKNHSDSKNIHSSQSISKHSTDSKTTSVSDTELQSKKSPSRYCTYGWCDVGKVPNGCTCTSEIHPCAWCIDSQLILSKMCTWCQDL